MSADTVQIWLKENVKGDPVIWSIVGLLSMLSIWVVYSSVSVPAFRYMGGDTEYYLIKHIVLIAISLGAMYLAHRMNYVYYSRLSRFALILSVPLLIYTYLNGVNINEASRWIVIPVINQTFQTSDFAKLALISNLASMLAKRQKNIESKESLYPILLWCGLICGLIALSDLSTSIMLFSTCMVIMFIGRVPLRNLFMLVVIGGAFVLTALLVGQRMDTAVSRVHDWWDMVAGNTSIYNMPYQVQQANIAISSGGLTGVGPGQSQQRYFLPEAYSDYIYAIINEEYGSIIGIAVLFLYLGLLYRGMTVASRSEKAFGGLLSAGLSFSLVIQAVMNMGVVVGLGPVTGVPLPLLSMGGTSLLFTGLALGIILSVSRKDHEEHIKSGKFTSEEVEK